MRNLSGREEQNMAIQSYEDDVWYFAYGSNMDCDQKCERTGTIREARVAQLQGFRLAFNKRRKSDESVVANIMPDASSVTWGVIYRCRPDAITTLDKFEGVRQGHYSRKTVNVITRDGESIEALAYVAMMAFVCDEGIPSVEYLRHILNGAKQHGLPGGYIAAIERLASHGNTR
jgi:cation transport regulator ChaC